MDDEDIGEDYENFSSINNILDDGDDEDAAANSSPAHGLTVQELKELTRARLSAAIAPSDSSTIDLNVGNDLGDFDVTSLFGANNAANSAAASSIWGSDGFGEDGSDLFGEKGQAGVNEGVGGQQQAPNSPNARLGARMLQIITQSYVDGEISKEERDQRKKNVLNDTERYNSGLVEGEQ